MSRLDTRQCDIGTPLARGRNPRALWGRRATLAVLLVLVVGALGGALGVHTSTASATGSGWALRLDYPAVARAGLDVTWRATVTRPGGFGKEITLAITGDYFDIYETQGFHPNPSDETRDGHTLYLTFTAPPHGDRFVLVFDTYVQPAAQTGKSATVAVVDPTTLQPYTSVQVTTRLAP